MDADLVAGRSCGACNVCCVALTIDEPDLQKPQGYRCRHLGTDGCTIYETRPSTCRSFFCGWRRLKWVREPLRPDLSGVLIRLHGEVSKLGEQRMGIAVTILTNAGLRAEGLAETVAAAVAAGAPVYLHEPGAPGYTASIGRINEALEGAVVARDKKAVLDILRLARVEARAGKREPIVLRPHRPGAEPSGSD